MRTIRLRHLVTTAFLILACGLAHAGTQITTPARPGDMVMKERVAPPERRASTTAQASAETLLDASGRLARRVPAAQVAMWRSELHGSHLRPERRSTLLLWLGEYEVGSEQPQRALWFFQQVRKLAGAKSRSGGRAAYDSALALDFAGRYQAARHAFARLVNPKTALPGYDRKTCALWERHASACLGYHNVRSKA